MVIRELTLHNFGIYASTNKFEFVGNKPVVLIGGMNGRGKTTFLEAVLLSLYGANSFAYKESTYKNFGQYLKSFVNVADGTLKTYIDLEFILDAEVYRVHREWTGDKIRTSDTVKVYKDSEYNQFLTDNWSMFIENILPSGLSNFFFFDGEKIAELAVEETSTQMKESIKTLLGISVLDLLTGDLNRVATRLARNQVKDSEANEIDVLREKKENMLLALENVDAELASLEDKRKKLAQKLEQKRQEYSAKGGDIVTQRQELFRKRTDAMLHIQALKEQLIYDTTTELPLLLVLNQLGSIRKDAEIAQEQHMLDVAIKKMRALLPEYAQTHAEDKIAIAGFVDFINGKVDLSSQSFKSNLSDTSLFKLQRLLDEQLESTKHTVKSRQDEITRLQTEVDLLDNYMAVDIDEEAITEIYRQIKECEQELIEIDVLISKKTDERRKYNGDAITATSVFNKRVEEYLKRVEVNDDDERMNKYIQMALKILDEYKIRLQRNKIDIVAETMTTCYKKLANKKNLIDRIIMDPVTLDLKYINIDGEDVNKASLSAGEKQLMVISLLWALALCSRKKLPVIIDTPLSRLDSAHRVSLIKTYFPNASEQTIILSTDSEIDKYYYELMKEDIGDEFTLNYDDMTKATSISRGYFLGDEYGH